MKKTISLLGLLLSSVVCASSDHWALDDEAPLPSFAHFNEQLPKPVHVHAFHILEESTHDASDDSEAFLPPVRSLFPNITSPSAASSSQCSDDRPLLQLSPLTSVHMSASKEVSTHDLLERIVSIQDSTKIAFYTKNYKERVALFLNEKKVSPQEMYARMEKLEKKEQINWKSDYPLVFHALVALRTQEKADRHGVFVPAPRGTSAKRSYDKAVSTQTLLAWFKEQSTPMTSPEEHPDLLQQAAQAHNLSLAAIFGRLEGYKKKHQSDASLWTPELEALRKCASQMRMKLYAYQKEEKYTHSQDTSKPATKSESLVEWFIEQNMPMTSVQERQALLRKAAQEHGLEYSTMYGRLDAYRKKHQSDTRLWTPELDALRKCANQMRMKISAEKKKETTSKKPS